MLVYSLIILVGRIVNKPAGKLLSLEAGRALAALAVVAFHAEVFGANLFTQTRHFWFDWGSHGVDFFFVLSGFIIFHAHRHDAPGFESAYAYIVKRLRRSVMTGKAR